MHLAIGSCPLPDRHVTFWMLRFSDMAICGGLLVAAGQMRYLLDSRWRRSRARLERGSPHGGLPDGNHGLPRHALDKAPPVDSGQTRPAIAGCPADPALQLVRLAENCGSGDDAGLLAKAENFITLFHAESQGAESPGTYRHTAAELTFAAQVAWRNSARCIGRLYWRSLRVRDRRNVS